MDSAILDKFPEWKLSCATNVSANRRAMPFKKANLEAYFYQISPNRPRIWVDLATDIVEAEGEFKNYAGELAFFKQDLTPIKPHIRFIMIPEHKKTLIKAVRNLGFKVVTTPNNPWNENYLDPIFFGFEN